MTLVKIKIVQKFLVKTVRFVKTEIKLIVKTVQSVGKLSKVSFGILLKEKSSSILKRQLF